MKDKNPEVEVKYIKIGEGLMKIVTTRGDEVVEMLARYIPGEQEEDYLRKIDEEPDFKEVIKIGSIWKTVLNFFFPFRR